MKFWLTLGVMLTLSTLLVLGVDSLARARARWRRRRGAQGGCYGVVVDARGTVLGTYVDPTRAPHRSSRVHGPGSVWTGSDPSDSTGWAWEGRAETEEEALHLANRLRHFHVRMIPELRERAEFGDGEEESRESSSWK